MAKRIATLKAYIQHHAMNSFELFIAALIVLSVLLFAVETLPNKGPLLMQMLAWADSVFLVVFSTEYLLRIWLEHKKTDYIFSFYGIVDLICILPFYFAILMGLESLRLLRLFRLLRIFKMVRYSRAINRVWLAIYSAREELIVFFGASLIMIVLSAVGIYHFEHQAQPEVYRSLFDALWWAVVTLTTVGYGDTYPITMAGRLFTFIMLMIGLGLIAVPTSIVTSSLSSIKQRIVLDDEENKDK